MQCIQLLTLSSEQIAPWTFRPAPDVEQLTVDALDRLRWSKTMLVNEALRRGIPIILAEQKKRFSSLTGESEAGEAAKAVVAVQRRAKRRRDLEGGEPFPS